jgi:putative regulatory protein, FmdB family
MPIYEYRCEDCGMKFEKLIRGTSDTATLACPSCGESHLNRELSTFAAHSSHGNQSASFEGGCPSGMCRTPELCGRN